MEVPEEEELEKYVEIEVRESATNFNESAERLSPDPDKGSDNNSEPKPSADVLMTTSSTVKRYKKKQKMYNVSLQVRPRDLDNYEDAGGLAPSKNRPKSKVKYYRDENGQLVREGDKSSHRENSADIGVGPDEGIDGRPKMYDVSLGVGVLGITKSMLDGIYNEDFDALTDEERGLGSRKRYDVSCSCGPQQITPDMLIGEYGQDFSEELDESMKYTPSEYEMKLFLERKPSLRIEDATLARPAGYRELALGTPYDALKLEIGTQANEMEIEQDLAHARNIKFAPKGNTLWPMNEEFDKERVIKRIEDYINRCWSLDPNWQFHIQYLQKYCHEHNKQRLIYEVKFSLPTILNPVPAATASVYFIIDVSFFDNYYDSVKVHYVVEGTRFQHTPGAIPFQQRWLRGIIVEKTKLQRLIDF